jgi:hypothetical protein
MGCEREQVVVEVMLVKQRRPRGDGHVQPQREWVRELVEPQGAYSGGILRPSISRK